jgi:hypothetical protein
MAAGANFDMLADQRICAYLDILGQSRTGVDYCGGMYHLRPGIAV